MSTHLPRLPLLMSGFVAQLWKAAGPCHFLRRDSNSDWSTGVVFFGSSCSLGCQSTAGSKRGCFRQRASRARLAHGITCSPEASSLCLYWPGWLRVLPPPGDSCGDLDDIGSRQQRGVISPQKALRTNAPLVVTCVFNIAFQSCGKERTASHRRQTNLLQLTCAASVEPSDPDLDGNHCKYFPARPVEDSFNRASQGN